MNTERSSARALAAVFCGHGRPFRLEEYPIPSPGPGEILVDVGCTTICGSDLHTWAGRRDEPTPCVLGHEIVGRIVAFGPGAPRTDLRGEPLAEGTRITWTLAASCGSCFFCRHELPQKCEQLFKYGHSALVAGHEFSGGFAECCVLRSGTGILRLPDSLSDSLVAPANCAVATVAGAFRHAPPARDSVVAIIGCGVLGLTACAMAKDLGAATVIACDLDPGRCETAHRFGADTFCPPEELSLRCGEFTRDRGADLSLEFSGTDPAVGSALAATRIGGTALIAGATTPGGIVQFDPNELVRRMLCIKGLHNYAPCDLVSAVDFLTASADRVPYELLQGDSFPLERVEEAFAASAQRSGMRTAVIP